MSDKNKTEEPVDAEFETLDPVEDNAASGTAEVKAKPVRLVLPVGIAVLVIIIAWASWAFVFNKAPAPQNEADRVALNDLTARVDALQTDAEASQKNIIARLNALESAPDATGASLQTIEDLQVRLTALEKAPSNTSLLEQRLDRLETQIGTMGSGVQNSAPPAQQLIDILDRLDALESAQRSTDQGAPSTAQIERLGTLEDEISSLQSRLDALEVKNTRTNGTAGLSLGILALDGAAQTGQPFEAEWRALAKQLPQNSDLLVIKPLAATGVPSQNALVRSFAQTLQAIRDAANSGDLDRPGMVDKAKAALGSIISVRRIDGNAKGMDAVLTRAEAALEDEDLSTAVQALGELEGAAQRAAQGWLAQASARITLSQAIARLKAMAGADTVTEVTP